ncbi:JmjC domain-containing protein [Paraliomyxa miuraensis]|uniref:JmjC domain-containing protein n=1 Tax=Paraliomyxa miuraensis TaxID=376150 RepID=UPI002256A7C4|nr:cupin domain-containing protein [Paraliomyxa miuraensis]MCX4240539.1 cupin domain-containing protein [Paraliomyxa miuraensis]
MLRAHLASEEELWGWIVAACRNVDERGRNRDIPDIKVRFFVCPEARDARYEGAGLAHAPAEFLPRESDVSLAAYTERMMRLLDGQRFGLVVNGLQLVDFAFCERVRDFIFDYQSLNGIRATPAVIAFLGNYDRTAFGAHADQQCADVFQFVISGRKRMRLWSGPQVEANPALERALSQRPSDYMPESWASVTIDGNPGELLYWPGEAWHVGEAIDEEPHMCVSVSLVPPFLTLDALLEAAVDHVLRNTIAVCFPQDAAPHPVGGISDPIVDETCARAIGALDEELYARVRQQWLCASTSLGMKHPRRSPDDVLRAGDCISSDSRLLQCCPDGSELLVVSVGVALRCSAGMKGLLDDLRTERAWIVDELVARHAVEHEAKAIEVLLDELHSTGSIRKITADRADGVASTGPKRA